MMAPSTSTRRLVRRTDDRVVAGVASGLADLLDVDPVLVRVGFVVLAFAGGSGIIAYLALWLLTPEGPGGTPTGSVRDRGAAFWVAIGLFVLAGLAIADSVADRSVVWPLVLVGVGVALWRSDGWSTPAASGGTDPVSIQEPTTTATSSATASGAGGVPGTARTEPVTAPRWTPPPPPGGGGTDPGSGSAAGGWTPPGPRARSVLGRVTVGIALLAVGVLALLDRAGVLALTFPDAVAVAMLVLGLGLVVGTWVGRARWLALPGVLLLLPVLVLSTTTTQLGITVADGVGERRVGTTAVSEVAEEYRHGIGQLTVDLGELDLDGQVVRTAASVGIGELVVVVPADATVVVDYEVAAGELELLDRSINGQSLEGREEVAGNADAGTVRLDVRVGLGQVEIVRGEAPR